MLYLITTVIPVALLLPAFIGMMVAEALPVRIRGEDARREDSLLKALRQAEEQMRRRATTA